MELNSYVQAGTSRMNLKRFPVRVVRVFSGSGRNAPLFRDVQDQIAELADVLKAGNGVEASAVRVADEKLGAKKGMQKAE
jgi:hypothetical protein